MLLSLKQVLKLSGIRNLSVKFVPADAVIDINFIYQNKNYSHKISFQEIEQAFSDSDSTHQDAGLCKNTVGGV
jgi:hypothetical protein